MYIYIYIYIHICIYIHLCITISLCLYVHIYIYTCTHEDVQLMLTSIVADHSTSKRSFTAPGGAGRARFPSRQRHLCAGTGLYCLLLPPVASRYHPLPISLPPTASRCLPLLPIAYRCLPLPPFASRCLSLHPVVSRGLPCLSA